MKVYEITINEEKHVLEGKSAMDAVVDTLNRLKLRYEYTKFSVVELPDAED